MARESVVQLARALSGLLDEPVFRLERLRGGDVAEAYRVELGSGKTVFAKTHRAPPPGFFTTEAAGLSWLREADALPVPEVLVVSDGGDTTPPVLVLEWIPENRRETPDDEAFGSGLAALHAVGAPGFGREDHRTTGSRALPNQPRPTWAEFYATQRLAPLARLVRDAPGLRPEVSSGLSTGLETVAAGIIELAGPPEPPARIHGDLWAGNRVVDDQRRSWLIDPACFGGHREFDLAMMRLFGGFGDEAFIAYEEQLPLADGWEERTALHQLAPLAVHAVKFGHSYVPALQQALRALGA